MDWILSWFDKDKDRAWSEEEFMKGFKDKPGKPLLVGSSSRWLRGRYRDSLSLVSKPKHPRNPFSASSR